MTPATGHLFAATQRPRINYNLPSKQNNFTVKWEMFLFDNGTMKYYVSCFALFIRRNQHSVYEISLQSAACKLSDLNTLE